MTRKNSPLCYRLDSSDQFNHQRVVWFEDDDSVTVSVPAGVYTDEYEAQAALKAKHKAMKEEVVTDAV